MSIVTRGGDKGTTGLFGGKRVPKHATRIHAYGTVDELNALLGLALVEEQMNEDLRTQLTRIQQTLFRVGGDLATPMEKTSKVDRMAETHVEEVETWIFTLEPDLPEQKSFLLPGGSRLGAVLHHARTVCRNAERWVSALGDQEPVNPFVQVYLNRLGDFLFIAARKTNLDDGKEEKAVTYE